MLKPLLLAALVGGAMTVGILLGGFSAMEKNNDNPREDTDGEIYNLQGAIDTFRQEHHVLPTTLGQLRSVADEDSAHGIASMFSLTNDGKILDGWNHPLVYSVSGTDYTLTSYGADGGPGGVGDACDMSSGPLPPCDHFPTVPQRLRLPSNQPVDFAALATGLAAFVLILAAVRETDFSRTGWHVLRAKLALIMLIGSGATVLVVGHFMPAR